VQRQFSNVFGLIPRICAACGVVSKGMVKSGDVILPSSQFEQPLLGCMIKILGKSVPIKYREFVPNLKRTQTLPHQLAGY
jgi:hypothetical protein